MSIEIPKTNCKGCDARDRLIARLSLVLDEVAESRRRWMDLVKSAWYETRNLDERERRDNAKFPDEVSDAVEPKAA